MVEMTMARLQEAMLVLYAVSLVFYFIDFLKKEPHAQRAAFWLTAAVFFMQTGFLLRTIILTRQLPVLSLTDGVYFFTWILIALSLGIQLRYSSSYAGFFLNVIGFSFMTFHIFAPAGPAGSGVGEPLISELLFIHITFAILSYAAFAMAFVFAILYLLVYNLLKKKKWSAQFSRLPSLQHALTGTKSAIYTGIPMLLVSLILGIQWAYTALDDWTIFDFKIVGSFLLLIVYSSLLMLNRRGKLQAADFAWANVIAFVLIIINFFLGSRLSQFHFWL
ncbi:cytochrome c biogenesis protein CcsA [Sporosarcina trichiuri]|uniref:cytochrome c biogenesis protein CcsA n=1 Tax=Sporosarcina trichiuri TaxID=3056445 RepID=UPI0025B4FC8E|nr:cytochrome c biogenesis protein CcsA [Sporosarcina sp. 0.2-SM1T-5]WJY28153.1 cytochrome c biogenesis protein CcsA [Sporosarcina sp. 0.2-SM1T-5]